MKKEQTEKIEHLKKWLEKNWGTPLDVERNRLRKRIEIQAVPMEHIHYSEENFKVKFPNNMVKTPIGEIPLTYYQFRKLGLKGRKKYIGGMEETLKNPSVIIKENKNGEAAELGYKGFSNQPKIEGLMSVIANKDGNKFVISTYPNKIKKYLEKLKDTADIVYKKPYSGGTAGNDPQNLANTSIDDTQSKLNISQTPPNVNDKKNNIFVTKKPPKNPSK